MNVGGMSPVEAPRVGVALVSADDHPADLLAEVHETVRVAHRRQIAWHRPARSGDRVLVGHRHDRHVDAGEASDLVAVDPAGVDDDLALDASPVGVDVVDATTAVRLDDADPGDPRARRDLDAPPAAPAASAIVRSDGLS